VYGNRIVYGSGNYDVARDADALIILTEWSEFRSPDFDRLKSLLKEPVIFDGRNILQVEDVLKLGFTYYSVGRPIG
jgi:UDPglucose 6-dehydrogenase